MPETNRKKTFDVFLSYNSEDKQPAQDVANELEKLGLQVWLDKQELMPGQDWQEELESIIDTVPTVAVLVGKNNLGPWQKVEVRNCLNQRVERKLRVIPVLLPGAPANPKLPPFLSNLTLVDLSSGLTKDGLDRLKLGIIGRRQKPSSGITVVIPTGGEGTSMFPITTFIPKCLVMIGNKPMLRHILDQLYENRDIFKNVIVITRNFSSMIEENIKGHYEEDFLNCIKIEKNVPGALMEIKDRINDDCFLLYYNDILIEKINWHHAINTYRGLKETHNIIGMLLCSKFYPLGIGVIREDSSGLLASFDEKPVSLYEVYANMGVSFFDKKLITDLIEESDENIFEATLKRVMEEKNRLGTYKVEKWYHIHDIKDLRLMKQKYDKEE